MPVHRGAAGDNVTRLCARTTRPHLRQARSSRGGDPRGGPLPASPKARDLLTPYVPVAMSMQIVLRIHRTMTGEEIDRAIATVVAGQALALERVRRAAWRRTVQNAASFATSSPRH
jgi:hypothetical protein